MDCGDKCAKILLFVFNLVTFLCGIAVLVIGIVLTVKEPGYVSLIGSEVFTICIAMIVVGCVITIVSFFGCCGAIKENTCMLYTFACILAVIFVAELAVAIVAFIYHDDLEGDFTKAMSDNMPVCSKDPNKDSDVNLCDEWDSMQDELDCCGASNYTDWTKGNWIGEDGSALPPSCCDSGKCSSANAYPGCVDQAIGVFGPYVWIIAGVVLGVAVLELFGIGIACCLGHSIKRQLSTHYA